MYHQVNLGSWAEIDEFPPSVVLLIRPETVTSGVRYGTVLYFLNACIFIYLFLPWHPRWEIHYPCLCHQSAV